MYSKESSWKPIRSRPNGIEMIWMENNNWNYILQLSYYYYKEKYRKAIKDIIFW